jgi:hypothetical protein
MFHRRRSDAKAAGCRLAFTETGPDTPAEPDPSFRNMIRLGFQVGTIDLGGRGYSIALVGDRPWTSPTNGQIVRIDPITHAVDRVIAPGPGFSGGGDVVVAAGSFWVVDGAANRVLRLPIAPFGG